MRDLAVSAVSALAAPELRAFTALKLTIDGADYTYTDCDVPLAPGGVIYRPCSITAGSIRYSRSTIVDQAAITIDNVGRELHDVFVGGTPRGSVIELGLILLDKDYGVISSAVVPTFEGIIGPWSLTERIISITAVSLLAKWDTLTLCRHPASCRWRKFKGAQCRYDGPESWCDRSYARCRALGNTDNFGGFRFLPDLMDKELWWGRTRTAG